MYKKNLLAFLLICLMSTFGYSAAILYLPGGDPPPKINLAIGNWNHIMNPHGCVELDEGQALKIKMVFTVGIDNIDPFPSIFYQTHFYDGSQDIPSTQITSADLTPYTFSNGFTVYAFIKDVFVMTYKDECEFNPSKLMDFEYSIKLTDGDGNPYPIDLYPELLIPTPPANFPSGQQPMSPIIPSLTYEGLKNLCCYDPSTPPQEMVQNTNNQIVNSNVNEAVDLKMNVVADSAADKIAMKNDAQISIFPNPFNSHLTINYQSEVPSSTQVEFWNLNGHLVDRFAFTTESTSIQSVPIKTSHLENGIYYCRVISATNLHTFKIIKTGR